MNLILCFYLTVLPPCWNARKCHDAECSSETGGDFRKCGGGNPRREDKVAAEGGMNMYQGDCNHGNQLRSQTLVKRSRLLLISKERVFRISSFCRTSIPVGIVTREGEGWKGGPSAWWDFPFQAFDIIIPLHLPRALSSPAHLWSAVYKQIAVTYEK